MFMAIRRKIGSFRSKCIAYNFGGRKNLTLEEGNTALSEIILSGKPASVLRMGFAELETMYEFEKHKGDKEYIYKRTLAFDNGEEIEKYGNLIIQAYKNADMIANFYSKIDEGKLIKKYAENAILVPNRTVEPYYSSMPWSRALKGKKVLVVHIFEDEIQMQYLKRDKLFESEVLPEFELQTLKPVWYLSLVKRDERFSNWFEALEYLKAEISKRDFDIALLGCGPFGVPLCDYIKSMGKQAIYIGGALQILFGIKGNRWLNHPYISKLMNEYWISPNDSSKPKNAEKMENACYW